MIAAIASGKGGTGKTTVTASLASIWNDPLTVADLDVEEPNLHLFLAPRIQAAEPVHLEVPQIDHAKCTACGACADLCQFGAITVMASMTLTFAEMCHGCGGCMAVCPEGAISPGKRELGVMDSGVLPGPGGVDFLMGRLRVGEAMTPPLMRAVKARLAETLADKGGDALIDAPPGVSCPAVAAVVDADCVVLVTEPTPFGFHDFCLAVEAFEDLGKPMFAVVNRAGLGERDIYGFCRDKSLPILAEIPFDRAIAEGYAEGRVAASLTPELARTFAGLRDRLRAAMAKKAEGAK